MKIETKTAFVIVVMLLATTAGSTMLANGAGPLQQYFHLDPGLSDEEIDGLLYMREEEKVARDVYTYFHGIFPVPIFDNISRSEQWHMDQILLLLNEYDLDDPVGTNGYGEFTNPDLQSLYDYLTGIGSTDFVTALYVGAFIEEVDILDLEDHINTTTHADIRTTYENLQWASGNHLRAFVRQLSFQGITYEPILLDIDTFNAIMNR